MRIKENKTMQEIVEFKTVEQLIKALPKMELDTTYFIDEYQTYIGLDGMEHTTELIVEWTIDRYYGKEVIGIKEPIDGWGGSSDYIMVRSTDTREKLINTLIEKVKHIAHV